MKDIKTLPTDLMTEEAEIIKILNKFSEEYYQQLNRSSNYVTNSIKKLIGDYGCSEVVKCEVCTSGFPDYFNNEWLYDMVWYKEDLTTKQLISVELVLELEQHVRGIADIKYDFEKLLVANAKVRVIICTTGKIPITDIQKYFSEAFNRYSGLKKGDRILTIIWDDSDTGKFIPQLLVK